MLIAKIENGKVIDISDMRSMFPDTSFPDNGPNDDWFTENSCMKLNLSAPYNYETEQLEPCEPYIVDGVVFTNKAVAKTEPIIITELVTIAEMGSATPI